MKKRKPQKIMFVLLIVMGTAILITSIYFLQSKYTTKVETTAVQQAVTEEISPSDIATPEPEATPVVTEVQEPSPPPVNSAPTTWPVLLTNTEATSLTVVVNKKHKLPSDYVPSVSSASGATMRTEALDALKKLLADSQSAGLPMKVLSSYRSYSTQVATYDRWVSQSGQAAADTFSARPGHSEHQLGLAVDLGELSSNACDLETCFGNTSTGEWLANNAQNYGFIIRYPSGKDSITGYQYEPWHLRYVGSVATDIVSSGKTLDEYYGVAAGDYQ